MTQAMTKLILGPHPGMHNAILRLADALSEEEFTIFPSPTAPPIGWHLFHLVRWADRLQASFPNVSPEEAQDASLPRQFWVVDEIPARWELDPKRLGWLEMGAGMTIEASTDLMAVGKEMLMDYARKSIDAANAVFETISDDILMLPRYSILPAYDVDPDTGAVFGAGPREATVLFDLQFYCSHQNRHLGMIEALRGAMFSIPGTASV